MSMTRAWTAVALLTLVGMINMIDRAMPGVMVEPIKHDLQLSNSALGLVNGFGFLLVYSVMGIPIARLADRAAYGLVISGCIALWSAMTLLGSFVHNGWQLAVTRMGVALGEAGTRRRRMPSWRAILRHSRAQRRCRCLPFRYPSQSSPRSLAAASWRRCMAGARPSRRWGSPAW